MKDETRWIKFRQLREMLTDNPDVPVCAIERSIHDDIDEINSVTNIAGNLRNWGGFDLDPTKTPLTKAAPDLGKKGLRVTFKGGFNKTEGEVRKQMAVLDFVCDPERDGMEGEYDPEDKYESGSKRSSTVDQAMTNPLLYRADDGEGDDETAPKNVQLGIENDPSLVFKSYRPMVGEPSVDVLHLQWSSKHVCESSADDGSGEDDGDEQPRGDSHWGFFTWLVIL